MEPGLHILTLPPPVPVSSGWPAPVSLGLAVFWGVLACCVARNTGRWRQRAMAAAVAAGVPVLGWLTYEWGPVLGVTALILGMITLRWGARPPMAQVAEAPARG